MDDGFFVCEDIHGNRWQVEVSNNYVVAQADADGYYFNDTLPPLAWSVYELQKACRVIEKMG